MLLQIFCPLFLCKEIMILCKECKKYCLESRLQNFIVRIHQEQNVNIESCSAPSDQIHDRTQGMNQPAPDF